MAQFSNYILVCGGTGCRASHSEHIITALRKELDEAGLSDQVQVIRTGCFGFCEQGPIVKTVPDNTFYVSVKPEDAEAIVREHIIKGRKVERLLYVAPDTGRHVSDSKHMEFYKPQVRIALRNCGFIDPENINEYIARDGYAALGKVLEMRPEEVIREIMDSGLRGRGGGGFPTGKSPARCRPTRNTSSAMPTKATRGLSWTARYSKATPTPSSKPWPSTATAREPRKA